jgi:hypothetical protein
MPHPPQTSNANAIMAITAKSLLESFPHPIIPPIQGQPTYESITEVTQLLNSNAPSVYNDLGGSTHGHLILTGSVAVLATLLATPFLAPTNPGGPSPNIPNNANAHNTNVITRAHEKT